jgi:hypothetical protein
MAGTRRNKRRIRQLMTNLYPVAPLPKASLKNGEFGLGYHTPILIAQRV